MTTAIRWVLPLALILYIQSPATQDRPRSCIAPDAAKDAKFAPGQVWRYKTRQHEEGSTLTILKIESLRKVGTIIHIRVDKIRLRNCTGGPEPDKFEHMPFAREAIERSVTKMLRQISVPDFQEGYAQWRKACGGVYTISVADAIRVAEDGFRKNLGCSAAGGPETDLCEG
jgi:hypothetical protein